MIAHGDWYDYESKYTEGGMDLVVPAPISAAQRERVRRIAQEAFLRSALQRPRARRLLRHLAGPGAAERAEHDPGLHAHERLRAPVRGLGRRPTRSCSTGCSSWPSSATRASGPTATKAGDPALAAGGSAPRSPRGARAARRALRQLRDPQQVVARARWPAVSSPSVLRVASIARSPTRVQPGQRRRARCRAPRTPRSPIHPSASRSASPARRSAARVEVQAHAVLEVAEVGVS